MHFKFAYFYFVLIHLELKTINTFAHVRSRSFLENHTRFQTKIGKVFSDLQNGPYTLPFRAANTYMAYIREYPPGPENSIFVRLLIQRTSTKNFYFIPSPQSAVRVLYLVRVLYPVRVLYLVRILYPVRSP